MILSKSIKSFILQEEFRTCIGIVFAISLLLSAISLINWVFIINGSIAENLIYWITPIIALLIGFFSSVFYKANDEPCKLLGWDKRKLTAKTLTEE
jgi:hypothetical protein